MKLAYVQPCEHCGRPCRSAFLRSSSDSKKLTIACSQEHADLVRSPHKYSARRTTASNGRTYASRSEARRADVLELMRRSGDIARFDDQPRFNLAGVTYVADFKVYGRGGHIHIEDVKGFETPRFKDVKRLWILHGMYPLHVLHGRRLEIIYPEASE